MSENKNESEKEARFLAPESVEYVLCPECYGEMEAEAVVCPHCNANVKSKNKIPYILMLFFGGFGAIVILTGVIFEFPGPAMIVGGFLLLAASLVKRFV